MTNAPFASTENKFIDEQSLEELASKYLIVIFKIGFLKDRVVLYV